MTDNTHQTDRLKPLLKTRIRQPLCLLLETLHEGFVDDGASMFATLTIRYLTVSTSIV